MDWIFKVHLQAQKSPLAGPIKPNHPPDIHPPNLLNQPDRPEPINGRLTDGLSVNLFSTDGQRFCPIPNPPDPCPPLIVHVKGFQQIITMMY